MSSVLDRDALESSPLADLHLIANEIGVDGFRRLRKADLVDAIIAKQSGEDGAAAEVPEAETEAPAPAKPRRSRRAKAEPEPEPEPEPEAEAEVAEEELEEGATDEDASARGRRGRRGGRGRGRSRDEDRDGGEREERGGREPRAEAEDRVAEGLVELLGNGSAFIRLGEGTSDDDVYVSAAQVKRCELVSGDRVAGPVRAPRRSERFP